MTPESGKHTWAMLQSAEFTEALSRLPSKHRSQVARKALELLENPRPSGKTRTPLVSYDGLCRVRAGDYRIIYAYDDSVVQLLTLRQRNEATYDNLDELEVRHLEQFRQIKGSRPEGFNIPDWEELAKKWAQPKPPPVEQLPERITSAMLNELSVPSRYHDVLLTLSGVDELLDCEAVPAEIRECVLDRLCPPKPSPEVFELQAVVELEDLADRKAATASGPLQASVPPIPEPIMAARKSKTREPEKAGLPARIHIPSPMVIISTRKLEPMKPYRGNTSKGIGKETHYTVKLDGTVQLIYSVGARERALLTTDGHPDLVALVNEAKRRGGGTGGGRFLINEYRHVLVPTEKKQLLFAGVYTRDLEFEFDNTLITPVAPRGLRPGDPWPGPHAGVRYVLAAGASDIRYEEDTPRGTRLTVCLTDHHSPGALRGLLDMCRAVKPAGGALYINEARELFAPVSDGRTYRRLYVGHLGDRPWFPEPL